MSDLNKLTNNLETLRDKGVEISVDDFGSGYSSLRMLLQYPSSIIKLDRSLLQEITESDQKMHLSAVLFMHVINLARRYAWKV